MLFGQITHDDLGCASYLIGDERAGVAAVVDPRFEIDEYLELARYRGVTIEHVLETHNHADHVSGHGRLVAATGARIHVHRLADPAYEHEPFEDGWELRLGSPARSSSRCTSACSRFPTIVSSGRRISGARCAAKLALSVGVRNVAGLLAGGMTNWRQERHPVTQTERVAADELVGRLAEEPDLQLLDVRELREWNAGHVPGSVLTPWHDITGIPQGLDPTRPIAVICAAGVRAATAASLLTHHGATRVIHMIDGGASPCWLRVVCAWSRAPMRRPTCRRRSVTGPWVR